VLHSAAPSLDSVATLTEAAMVTVVAVARGMLAAVISAWDSGARPGKDLLAYSAGGIEACPRKTSYLQIEEALAPTTPSAPPALQELLVLQRLLLFLWPLLMLLPLLLMLLLQLVVVLKVN